MGLAERLGDLRRAHAPRLTQEALAELAGVSVATVRRLEQGTRKPSLVMLEKLAKALGVPASALFDNGAEPIASTPDTEEIRATSQQLVRLETLHGGDDVLPLALRAFRSASVRLEASNDASTDLEAAVGELGEVAAWIAFDAAELTESRRLIHEALLLSRAAGDADMERLELAHLSMLALHAHRPREALRIADETLAHRLSPRVSALFHLRRARALAQRGEEARARAAMNAADGATHESLTSSDPAWSWWINDSEIAWHRAMVATELDHHAEAIAHHAESVELAESESGRHIFLGRAFLLDSLTQVRAWRDSEPVMAGLLGRVGEVSSSRTTRILKRSVARALKGEHVSSTLSDTAAELSERLAS